MYLYKIKLNFIFPYLIKKNVHSNINNNKYCYIYSLVNIYF